MRGYHYFTYQVNLEDVSLTKLKNHRVAPFNISVLPCEREVPEGRRDLSSFRLCGPFLCLFRELQLPLVTHVAMMSGLSSPTSRSASHKERL
ncbi:MAG: hypothetical protein RL023_990 [Candidatus Parcubacteria bacterium]|jgi:hypothetical protein